MSAAATALADSPKPSEGEMRDGKDGMTSNGVSPITDDAKPITTQVPGGHAGGDPPVPIPNTEVKPSWADDTAIVRWWESKSLPG